jgi:hypothetical protein
MFRNYSILTLFSGVIALPNFSVCSSNLYITRSYIEILFQLRLRDFVMYRVLFLFSFAASKGTCASSMVFKNKDLTAFCFITSSDY